MNREYETIHELEERLVDQALREVVGGESPTDLTDRILAATRQGSVELKKQPASQLWLSWLVGLAALVVLSAILWPTIADRSRSVRTSGVSPAREQQQSTTWDDAVSKVSSVDREEAGVVSDEGGSTSDDLSDFSLDAASGNEEQPQNLFLSVDGVETKPPVPNLNAPASGDAPFMAPLRPSTNGSSGEAGQRAVSPSDVDFYSRRYSEVPRANPADGQQPKRATADFSSPNRGSEIREVRRPKFVHPEARPDASRATKSGPSSVTSNRYRNARDQVRNDIEVRYSAAQVKLAEQNAQVGLDGEGRQLNVPKVSGPPPVEVDQKAWESLRRRRAKYANTDGPQDRGGEATVIVNGKVLTTRVESEVGSRLESFTRMRPETRLRQIPVTTMVDGKPVTVTRSENYTVMVPETEAEPRGFRRNVRKFYDESGKEVVVDKHFQRRFEEQLGDDFGIDGLAELKGRNQLEVDLRKDPAFFELEKQLGEINRYIGQMANQNHEGKAVQELQAEALALSTELAKRARELTPRIKQRLLAESPGGDRYEPIYENSFIASKGYDAVSTFSIDVDTAAYSNMRQFLNSGQMPPPNAIRLEELINYFSYDYAGPDENAKHPFASHVEVASCPWNADHRLVRVGIKGRTVETDKRPRSNIVFLLDVSGSMSDANKLPLVIDGLSHMTYQLGENDNVAIVVYLSLIHI